jgi:putative FmdB family regulatory protein
MPTYDFLCGACDHRFEAFQSIKAEPLKACPSCGQERLVRLIGSGAGILLKGPGFHANDYPTRPTPETKRKDEP